MIQKTNVWKTAAGLLLCHNFDDDKLCSDDGSSGRACGEGGKYRNL